MYAFTQINNFVVANGSESYFEKDLQLFKTILPNSPIIPNLEKPFGPAKKGLDERMLLEMLNTGRVSFQDILANRKATQSANSDVNATNNNAASTTPQNNATPPPAAPEPSTNPFVEQLAVADLETMSYNEHKKLVFGLKLTVPNQRANTLKEALKQEQFNRGLKKN